MKHMEHRVMYTHAVPSFCVEYRNTIEVELIKIFFPATACKQNEKSCDNIIICVCTTGMAQPVSLHALHMPVALLLPLDSCPNSSWVVTLLFSSVYCKILRNTILTIP